MKRPCDLCGTVYEAKRATSKFCSSNCRTRKARGVVVDLPAGRLSGVVDESDVPMATPVETATLKALVEAGRLDSPLGAAAMMLARRMDSPGLDTGSAVAAVARQLEATLASATRGASAATAPQTLQDELAARRAAHGA